MPFKSSGSSVAPRDESTSQIGKLTRGIWDLTRGRKSLSRFGASSTILRRTSATSCCSLSPVRRCWRICWAPPRTVQLALPPPCTHLSVRTRTTRTTHTPLVVWRRVGVRASRGICKACGAGRQITSFHPRSQVGPRTAGGESYFRWRFGRDECVVALVFASPPSFFSISLCPTSHLSFLRHPLRACSFQQPNSPRAPLVCARRIYRRTTPRSTRAITRSICPRTLDCGAKSCAHVSKKFSA